MARKRTLSQRVGSIERKLNLISRQLNQVTSGQQGIYSGQNIPPQQLPAILTLVSPIYQRLTNLENSINSINTYLGYLFGGPSDAYRQQRTVERQPRIGGEEERNRFTQETNRILNEYARRLSQRKQEELDNLRREKEEICKKHPNDKKWNEWIESFYGPIERGMDEKYRNWLEGAQKIVECSINALS